MGYMYGISAHENGQRHPAGSLRIEDALRVAIKEHILTFEQLISHMPVADQVEICLRLIRKSQLEQEQAEETKKQVDTRRNSTDTFLNKEAAEKWYQEKIRNEYEWVRFVWNYLQALLDNSKNLPPTQLNPRTESKIGSSDELRLAIEAAFYRT